MAAHEFTITRRVEFSETDMAGIVHFSNFCRYMEHAEHAFFRSLDRSIVDPALGIGWPRALILMLSRLQRLRLLRGCRAVF